MTDDETISAVFCAGGTIAGDPSSIGVTWAWVGVTHAGTLLRALSGYVLPEHHPHFGWARVDADSVPAHYGALYASMRALESLPPRWTGPVALMDETVINHLLALRDGEAVDEIPADWRQRAGQAIALLGDLRFIRMAPGPSSYDLERGYAVVDGKKLNASRHSQAVEQTCQRLIAEHADRLNHEGAPA